VGSFAGVTEIRELAVVIVVGERSHRFSSRGLGIDQIFILREVLEEAEKASL
jgi:hypothetical protein